MARNDPDAGPKLLLEDYGKASQRWLRIYADAREAYKRPSASGPGRASATDIHVLIEPQASRTQRWLERFVREKADFGPLSPPPNLTAAETPDLDLLIEDYDTGPRFVQHLAGLMGSNGGSAHGHGGALSEGTPAPAAVPGAASGIRTATPGSSEPGAPRSPAPRAKTTAVLPAAAASASTNTEADSGLNLTLDAEDARSRAQRRQTQVFSLAFHAVWLIILVLQPYAAAPPPFEETLSGMETVTLIAPSAAELAEVIQRSPNQQQTTQLIEPTEQARPAVVLPASPAPAPEVIQAPDPPQVENEPQPEPIVPAPKLEIERPPPVELAAARSPAPGLTRQGENRPRLRPNELPVLNAPKATNEPNLPADRQTATGLGQDGDLQIGSVRLNARPDEIIQAATENLIATGGTQIVGDGFHSSGIGGALPSSPGNRGSTLELLSDPNGVDFRPYLIQVLAAVRRNWFAVIPESARLGMARGRVAIQFIVSKEGMVPKLVIADSSGTPHLDRAAVAGISASVPFQPLPSEFNGKEIRLQFVFLYNTKR